MTGSLEAKWLPMPDLEWTVFPHPKSYCIEYAEFSCNSEHRCHLSFLPLSTGELWKQTKDEQTHNSLILQLFIGCHIQNSSIDIGWIGWWLFSILIQLLGLLFLLLSFLFFPRRPIPTGQHFSSSDQQPSEQSWRCFLWSQVLLLCYSILSEVWVNWDLTPCHQCCVKWLINTEQETALALTNRAFSNQQCSWNVCPPIEPPLKEGLRLQLCDWAVCHLSLSTREQPHPSCPGIGKNM